MNLQQWFGKQTAVACPHNFVIQQPLPDRRHRVVARGAGIRIGRESSSALILAAIRRLLTEPQFGQNASAMAAILKNEGVGEQRAVEEIEGVLKAA